jgi:hypothetical protein
MAVIITATDFSLDPYGPPLGGPARQLDAIASHRLTTFSAA